MKRLLKRITPGFVIRLKHYFEKRYYRYHSETFSIAKELSKKTGISYLALLFDLNLSILKLIAPKDYRHYRFHDRSRAGRNRFLTLYRRDTMTWQFNAGDCSLTFNKHQFNRHFSDFLGRQWLYAPDASDQQIEGFLCAQKQFIVKPCDLCGGSGVRKILSSDITDVKAFCESARKNCLMLEEVVEQHPDLGSIHPSSVNTVRIYTVVDGAGVTHILCAVLRMGRGQSVTDNLTIDGIFAQIDLDTGVLFTLAVGKDCQTYIKHPTTGIVIPGFQIPYWEAAKEMVLRAAKMAPHIRWIGWDVAFTEKGPLLIEGNSYPDTRLMQLASQTGIYHVLRSYL